VIVDPPRDGLNFAAVARHDSRVRFAFVVVLAACRSAPAPTLPPAGDERDDGAGDLARASVQLELGSDAPGALADSPRRHHRDDDFGGTSYAGWQPPSNASPPPHPPRYTVVSSGLDGAIDGVVTWPGAPPRVDCGAGLRVGSDHAVRGAIIYIDHVALGRAFPSYSETTQVGGTLVKRGCALAPAVQVVAPAPATVAVRGDADAARLRVVAPNAAATTLELQSGGDLSFDVAPGVTKLDGADAALGPAWVIGVETPYVAVSDDDGHFRIDELPPATYDVTIFAAPSTHGGAPIVVHRSVHVAAGTTKLAVALH